MIMRERWQRKGVEKNEVWLITIFLAHTVSLARFCAAVRATTSRDSLAQYYEAICYSV